MKHVYIPDKYMIDERFCLFPLTADEKTTCESITQVPGSAITVMPTHHINELGDFMGFRYETDSYVLANTLPIVRTMFHGTTMVQCDIPEKQILELMMDNERVLAIMKEFLYETEQACIPATLDCIPENAGSITNAGVVQATGLRTVDSKPWTPEVPERIGIYHAYLRGYNRDVRTHKLFIVCTGGLYKACDDFCNLLIDVGQHWTANDVLISEETWWLRKACQRARCRLIKQLADKLDIEIKHMDDIQSYTPQSIAIPTTDTLEHDIAKKLDKICVYNGCIDTTKNMNGILCNMHPSEGVWLFKGAHKVASFGSMFGDYSVCGTFPLNAPRINRPSSLLVQDASYVTRYNQKIAREKYMYFDESYFKVLENMQWNRDNGYEPLIPIVVGLR